MIHVGAGWAYARLGRRLPRAIEKLDPLLRWLAVDGYGFHEGFFHPNVTVVKRQRRRPLGGYCARAFDQGLGRSLWFVEGAGVDAIAGIISSFESVRRPDLWAGVGLAAAYAGGVGGAELERLRDRAALDHSGELAQGAAFAARANQLAGNPTAHLELACQVLCRCSWERAAAVTEETLQELPDDGPVPAYEVWRGRIQKELSKKKVAVG